MTAEVPVRNSLTVQSTPSALEEPCCRILSTLEEKGFGRDDIFAVHLAVEEAFLNAVKHGNKMDPAKSVMIEYAVDPEKVEIRMTDEGPGFDPATIPDPRVGENLYRPEGRGLLLISAYMHVVEYSDRGNSLRMVRYKGRPIPEQGSAETA